MPSGKIKRIFVRGTGVDFGPPGDAMGVEVIVILDNDPTNAWGIKLRQDDPELSANLTMVSVLRDAFVNDYTINLGGENVPNANPMFIVDRVDISKYATRTQICNSSLSDSVR